LGKEEVRCANRHSPDAPFRECGRLRLVRDVNIANHTLHPVLGEYLKAKLLLPWPGLCKGTAGSFLLLELKGLRRSWRPHIRGLGLSEQNEELASVIIKVLDPPSFTIRLL
jgi:hypothetical protein